MEGRVMARTRQISVHQGACRRCGRSQGNTNYAPGKQQWNVSVPNRFAKAWVVETLYGSLRGKLVTDVSAIRTMGFRRSGRMTTISCRPFRGILDSAIALITIQSGCPGGH